MRVFVSEYVCGGAWPDDTLDRSLAVEGRAMLTALLEDLLLIPEIHIVSTWDRRLGTFPVAPSSRLSIVEIASVREEDREFRRLCSECAAAFVIAPEFHGILASRVHTASTRTRLIGCDSESTTLCSDKLRLAAFLSKAGISTIPTEPFEPARNGIVAPGFTPEFPCVIKPLDGAGSLLTFKTSTPADLAQCSEQILNSNDGFSFIRQPFVDGIAVSCAAIVGAGDASQAESNELAHIDVLLPCEQILSDDGRFTYQGADFPGRVSASLREQIEQSVRRCCISIPGLHGYVGFDLLVPFHTDAEPVVVEINPRLTTGYLLWRKLSRDNLAARLLAPLTSNGRTARAALSWNSSPQTIRIGELAT